MYWYRCNSSKCRMRVSFKKPIEKYVKEKRCACCGSKLHSVKFDKDHHKRNTCNCDGLHFPHQKKTKWCNYYEGEYTEEELRERHCA